MHLMKNAKLQFAFKIIHFYFQIIKSSIFQMYPNDMLFKILFKNACLACKIWDQMHFLIYFSLLVHQCNSLKKATECKVKTIK